MTIKVELELEFDPAKSTEIIAEARRLFLQSSSEYSVCDEDGNWRDAKPEEVGPFDITEAVVEIVHHAIDGFAFCERVGLSLYSTLTDEPKEEAIN